MKKRGKEFKAIPDEDNDEDLHRTQEPAQPEPHEAVEGVDQKEEPLMEADDFTNSQHETFDKYISAKVMVPRGDSLAFGTVVRRKRDVNGNVTAAAMLREKLSATRTLHDESASFPQSKSPLHLNPSRIDLPHESTRPNERRHAYIRKLHTNGTKPGTKPL